MTKDDTIDLLVCMLFAHVHVHLGVVADFMLHPWMDLPRNLTTSSVYPAELTPGFFLLLLFVQLAYHAIKVQEAKHSKDNIKKIVFFSNDTMLSFYPHIKQKCGLR